MHSIATQQPAAQLQADAPQLDIESTDPPETGVSAKEPYFGSVLFFKHMLLVTVIVLIAVPTALAVLFGTRLHASQERLDALAEQLSAAESSLLDAQESLKELEESSALLPSPLEAETPAYTELYPELYAEGADYGSVDVEKSVYLTFDDGPSARTDEILAILDKYGVKATFFVIGTSDEADLQRMRDIVAAGHTLAIHSFTHNYQTIYSSVEAYLEDFNQMYCQIVEATGVKPQIFRFPGGSINSYNNKIYQEIIAEMTRRGFVYFDWNAANGDAASAKLQSPATLAANALDGIGKRRVIVLMHDSGGKTTTVDALSAIIEGYQDAGYTFAPLTAETRPITFGYHEWNG